MTNNISNVFNLTLTHRSKDEVVCVYVSDIHFGKC